MLLSKHGCSVLVFSLFSWCEVPSPGAAGWKTPPTPHAGEPRVPSEALSAVVSSPPAPRLFSPGKQF